MDDAQQKQKGTFEIRSSADCPPEGHKATSGPSAQDAPLRRLQRENHILRVQLLKLREQQRSLLRQVATVGLFCSSDDTQPSTAENAEAPQHASTAAIADADIEGPASRSGGFNSDDEATAVRARTLQRQEERKQRATSARALLPSMDQLLNDVTDAQLQQQRVQGSVAASREEEMPLSAPVALAKPLPAAPFSVLKVSAAKVTNTPSAVPPVPFGDDKSTVEDDSSAQAMLQRFQDRKAQRRLRLKQTLGRSYESGAAEDSVSDTTPFGSVPRHATGVHEDGLPSNTNNSSRSSSVIANNGGLESEALPGDTANTGGAGAAISHRAVRAGELAGSTSSPSAGPTQNPNQIGRVVSDAVRNNSWYLCKVLEAALLDTIQSRHVSDDSATHAQTPSCFSPVTPSASLSRPSSAQDRREEERGSSGTPTPQTLRSPQLAGVTPTSAVAPQFLYQEGVSDTALRRAIEESLVLSYRCMHDAPQRLTSHQAAEETVPPFNSENKDSELRRCFAGHASRGSIERGGGSEAYGVAENGGDDDSDCSDPSAIGTDDETLDPFARLLLARISAELPPSSAKREKKRNDNKGSSKQRDDFLQGPPYSSAESGQSFGATARKGAPPSSPSSSKPSRAFVMAAAGGDGKVHIPKKHFSRLDEVQVEMHAPVIFNQIRDFLRLDVDRFRRAFLYTGLRGETIIDGVNNSSTADEPRHCLTSQQQQRRVRAGAAAGAEEATAWRISVSPGKSGTTLLYFGDYVMKTVRPNEMEFFTRKFLPAYVRYCERNPHTLLPRFYASITVRWWKAGVVQHFVLMHNVLATPYYIHRIYDVKGSTVNRTALQPGKPPPRTAFGALLLKDNDLPPQLIICGAYQRAILLAQFRSDVGFLRQLSVVDYSCMIGVRSRLFSREDGPSKTIVLQRHQHHDNDEPYVDPLGGGDVPRPLGNHRHTNSEITNVTSAAADAGAQTVSVAGAGQLAPLSDGRPASEDDVYVCIHGCDGGLLSLPIYAPGDDTTAREDVYYLGIIDVLQTYNSAKKLESFAKGFVNDRRAISVIPPEGYSERLYKVLERITV
ncbi:putative phosphatidylinositol-4-phosphate 5-kinase [Leptomonas pyrrhocoris]|uniref:Putative phosphatidylinositol-4-phosphate 5-kinase n=1 Tax=Leptomonas pyrrhocoris TaxID=157538 RepID=A0A0M9GA33_LEPPY|nr:putative phosphatidylinositol-4-phosphate 5-kinase [Leptomonas pyrrhocoris]KPA85917.1 putative phosphatidylinositol-4-phosphate 5-kinase [Leptomonas pyrrhocoris]|eukprot:XP_015664356.1 putative phosphatidylinositol-4-phosphate 5-kinase [Leptomonas pyrrhocoris]